jgi:hypothetical protein
MGGGSDINEVSSKLGIPVEFLREAEGFEETDNSVYPDNMQAVSIFTDLLTQWRVGAMGATGLDYTALPVVMRFRKVKMADREDVFECIRVMESAALTEMRRK